MIRWGSIAACRALMGKFLIAEGTITDDNDSIAAAGSVHG
jgi:hypothetical protein